jgi:5-methyltetrahydropteroyltriglutamate--homocysteine methyltransferase
MVLATNLGFPRLGAQRELKWAIEKYWSGKSSQVELEKTARELCERHWKLQRDLGLDHIPSNDFSLYDHVLDTALMVGAVPPRFHIDQDLASLRVYFAMARGLQDPAARLDIAAQEMTKWFDTNYHYIVPEFTEDQHFHLNSTKVIEQFREARALSSDTRPVLLGPVSFLLLGKMSGNSSVSPLDLLPRLLPVYGQVLKGLEIAGGDWIQMDEPCLVLDLAPEAQQAFQSAYASLVSSVPRLRLLVATYFGDLRQNLRTALSLPIAAIHLDLVRAPGQLEAVLPEVPSSMALSLGVVDGRNIWRTDLDRAMFLIRKAVAKLGADRVLLAPSCSLLHVPVDLELEDQLEAGIKQWLAFGKQKLQEIRALADDANGDKEKADEAFRESRKAVKSRASSPLIHDPVVKQQLQAIQPGMTKRPSPYAERYPKQNGILNLPLFPTTTIGSFPQTHEVRAARSEFRTGKRDRASYEKFLREEIARAIRIQEELGLDVLVHGEFERNDMVEYFGEKLRGFAFTHHGWVQSYGTRAVKPPIIFGDISRPESMTVAWAKYAQSLTPKPVKGMLTGPVTMLQWSFVRDDQPRSVTCKQIALAMRGEVMDLEGAGIRVIQIDEPAIREGLPLRRKDWNEYLQWAVEAFRLASSGVNDLTQIHSHMCYSEFNDIMDSITAMDADVLSIEASRSRMEILQAFGQFRYPNGIGPGVYDIHSPRVPGQSEIEALLRKACEVLDPRQVWVNPDCGLKTRNWQEVRPALMAMVEAARRVRAARDN